MFGCSWLLLASFLSSAFATTASNKPAIRFGSVGYRPNVFSVSYNPAPTLQASLTCTWGEPYPGVHFDGVVLVGYDAVPSLEYCIRICGQTPGCASINWDRTRLICELNRDTVGVQNYWHKFQFKFNNKYVDNIRCSGAAPSAVAATPVHELPHGHTAGSSSTSSMSSIPPSQSQPTPSVPSHVAVPQPSPQPAVGAMVSLSQPISMQPVVQPPLPTFQLPHVPSPPQQHYYVNEFVHPAALPGAPAQSFPPQLSHPPATTATATQPTCGVQAPGHEPVLKGVVMTPSSFVYRAMDPRFGQQRIVGGRSAKEGNWPWTLAMHRGVQLFCGAALWQPDIAITAAHCLESGTNGVTVIIGDHNQLRPDPGEERLRIAKFIIHENYDDQTTNNDIALIKLERPVQLNNLKRTICLPTEGDGPTVGTSCTIAGWGTMRFDSRTNLPEMLQEASVTVMETSLCNDKHHYGGLVLPNMMCAGTREGGVDACQGDSGGPMVCKTDNVWYLQGIISWGNGCASSRFPGVYTKVANYVPWILDRASKL